MNHVSTYWNPDFFVQFTEAEVRMLEHLSKAHYDHKCKSLAELGGTIYGMTISQNMVGKCEVNLTRHDIDSFLKVLEIGEYGLRKQDELNGLFALQQQLRKLLQIVLPTYETADLGQLERIWEIWRADKPAG